MHHTIPPLDPDKLHTPCPAKALKFKTTADVDPLDGVIGQDRAVEAIRFAIGMRGDGYNLYALGPEGTGKQSTVHRFLSRQAATEPLPSDWCYVNNFDDPQKPVALAVPAGRASPLQSDMERLVDELQAAIDAAFESDNYRQRKEALEEDLKHRHEESFGQLQHRAEERDVALIRTPMGLALGPVQDGEVINAEDFDKLPSKERDKRAAAMVELQEELETILSEVPKWEKEHRERLRELNRDVTEYAVGHLIDELKKTWREQSQVIAYLDLVRADVIAHAADFLPQAEQEGQPSILPGQRQRPHGGAAAFRRYQINVLVDNSAHDGQEPNGAPIIEEEHPSQPNLVGRIEHLSQMGTLVTDFNLIRAGALHRASGGYLVLDARRLLMQPFAWETLKRALRSGHIKIESPAESFGLVSTVSLEPEPIPLDVKVVLLGEPMLYYLLSHYDPDFRELFKVAADFDDRMGRDGGAMEYARLIAGQVEKEGLRHLKSDAVRRIVEHGARLADDAEKLTVHMASIVDLVREANYWAGQDNQAKLVSAVHVQRAIDAKERRSDRLRARIQEEIARGTLVIETTGEQVGQVNGLAVLQLDSFRFGRPSRITASINLGKGEVVDIERQVELGGPLHSKGVMILESFLMSRFGQNAPLALSARLTFEQSYGGVEGDSASSTELYALLSALSGLPIRQSIAVTGSVDQKGRIQAIGGVNEKIEGFFDICVQRGLTGEEGVMIPASNVKHLMLRADVVTAAKAGKFHVWAVESIDQGIEILTGVAAGELQEDGSYPLNCVNRAVSRKLATLAAKARSFIVGPHQINNAAVKPPPQGR